MAVFGNSTQPEHQPNPSPFSASTTFPANNVTKQALLLVVFSPLLVCGCTPEASDPARVAGGSRSSETAVSPTDGENAELGSDAGADGPRSAGEYFQAAEQEEEAGRSSEAIQLYTRVIELDPENIEARRRLGRLLVRTRRYLDASVFFGQVVEREPNNPDALNDWGAVLVQIGNVKEAITQFEAAIASRPDHPDAHYNLATAYLAIGQVGECREHLQETLRVQPGYTDAHFTLGRTCLVEEKHGDAILQFLHVLNADREYEDVHYFLGRAYLGDGDVRNAVKYFSEAVRRDAYRAEPHYWLGMALAGYGKPRAAAAQFQEAARIAPERAESHYQLALALVELKRWDEAIAHNRLALAIRPDWSEALNNQAWLLATVEDEQLQDPAKALELAERAKALADRKMPRILGTLAAAQARSGRSDEAKRNAAEALRWARETGQEEFAEQVQSRLDSMTQAAPSP